MLDPQKVGRVIRSFRESKGLSQETVSTAAGICRTHLSAIEHGKRKPALDTFIKLSYAMDIPAADMLDALESECM